MAASRAQECAGPMANRRPRPAAAPTPRRQIGLAGQRHPGLMAPQQKPKGHPAWSAPPLHCAASASWKRRVCSRSGRRPRFRPWRTAMPSPSPRRWFSSSIAATPMIPSRASSSPIATNLPHCRARPPIPSMRPASHRCPASCTAMATGHSSNSPMSARSTAAFVFAARLWARAGLLRSLLKPSIGPSPTSPARPRSGRSFSPAAIPSCSPHAVWPR